LGLEVLPGSRGVRVLREKLKGSVLFPVGEKVSTGKERHRSHYASFFFTTETNGTGGGGHDKREKGQWPTFGQLKKKTGT